MEYPFIIDGERRGRLSVEQDGLFTVLEIWAELSGKLLRASVYGQGKEAYLGIMEPKGQGMYLRRRFSRREMEKLPDCIEYAGEAGLAARDTPDEKPPSISPFIHSQNTDEEDFLWYRKADGTLTAFDGESSIVAIPSRLRHVPDGAVLRIIEGQEYMLFRY